MNPYLQSFFNATAGLEKVIIAGATVVQTYIGAGTDWADPKKALVIGLIGLVQILYTSNTTPTPPEAPSSPLPQ